MHDLEFGFQLLRLRAYGLKFQDFNCGQDSGLRGSGLRFRVYGLNFQDLKRSTVLITI